MIAVRLERKQEVGRERVTGRARTPFIRGIDVEIMVQVLLPPLRTWTANRVVHGQEYIARREEAADWPH
jgi:hypothetical protein